MSFFAIVAGLCLLISLTGAQSSSSAYVDPSVPTGKPIPGDYTGALRPQIHYSPPKGFMVRLPVVSFRCRIDAYPGVKVLPSH